MLPGCCTPYVVFLEVGRGRREGVWYRSGFAGSWGMDLSLTWLLEVYAMLSCCITWFGVWRRVQACQEGFGDRHVFTFLDRENRSLPPA